MSTVDAVSQKVYSIQNRAIELQSKIYMAYEKYMKTITSGSSNEQLLQNEFIQDYTAKADMYDRLFQEQEAKFQKSGGRKRGQTIQEYVLFLFFVGFFLFAISLSIYTGHIGGGSTQVGGQVFFAMFIIMFISAAFIISYG